MDLPDNLPKHVVRLIEKAQDYANECTPEKKRYAEAYMAYYLSRRLNVGHVPYPELPDGMPALVAHAVRVSLHNILDLI